MLLPEIEPLATVVVCEDDETTIDSAPAAFQGERLPRSQTSWTISTFSCDIAYSDSPAGSRARSSSPISTGLCTRPLIPSHDRVHHARLTQFRVPADLVYGARKMKAA
jgi:hypothetical protein